MRFIAPFARREGREHRRTPVRRGLALVLFALCGWVSETAAQLPDTFPVENRATVRYGGGGSVIATSEAVSRVVVRRAPGVALAPPREGVIFPGGRRVFAHRLENRGDGMDAYTLTAEAPAGWVAALYLDVDDDGVLGAGDAPVTAPVPLSAGGSAAILLVVDAPADAAEGELEVVVTAVSGLSPEVRASVVDRLTLRRPLAALRITKTASVAEAARGDSVGYALTWGNDGDGPATSVVVADTLPGGLRYVAGSLRVGGASVTDAADADAGTVTRTPDGRDVVHIAVGTLDPAAEGGASFRAVIRTEAPAGPLSNVAVLGWTGGTTRSGPAVTVVGAPTLDLSKERVGPDTVDAGSEIGYRLRVANRSDTYAARGVVITDTLPATLIFVSSSHTVEREGADGRVLRWRLGTLAPGAEVEVELLTRLVYEVVDEPVVNVAHVGATNGEGTRAESETTVVRSFGGDELHLSKRATVLEAALGEAIPYVLTLRNTGGLPLRGIQVVDVLPDGVRIDTARIAGVDSARVHGRDVHLYWDGPLAPNAEHEIRYSIIPITAPRGGALQNRATARAEGGLVATDTVSAWVRLRGAPLSSRVVLGSVWVDLDGDGRRGPGEPGIGGADIWSADGERITTDPEGRFSFPEVRTGTHAFRLDERSLPAGLRLAVRAEEVQRVRADGWTTPTLSFRLVPTEDSEFLQTLARDTATGMEPILLAGDTLPAAGAGDPSAAEDAELPDAGPTVPATDPLPADAAPEVPTEFPAPDTLPVAQVADTLPAEPVADVPPPVLITPTVLSSATVDPLRPAEERSAEEERIFIEGPVVRITSPGDGSVVIGNRSYVGLLGEPGAPARLYVDDREVGEVALRPDGVADFVGVELVPGPQTLRAWMRNSWGRERWDSVRVHRAGPPARLQGPHGAVVLRADSREVVTVRVRAVDEWGVPAAGRAAAAAEVHGARFARPEGDTTSLGWQGSVDADGWLEIPLRGGRETGTGELRVRVGKLSVVVPLEILPTDRAMVATGIAQVGIGSTENAFGAVTARGALDDRTALTVTFDSRRSDPTTEFFDRGYDLMEEGRYPTLGDGSERSTFGSATQVFSARLERGLDWLELGDVETRGFSGSERLGGYPRSLTGAAARVGTGPFVWRAFGSFTDQALVQEQRRANGTSGPYRFGGAVRPGTERIAIEVRARDNAARLLRREELVRSFDYQIDYRTGEVLLQRPLPSEDLYGNPIFLVAVLERRGSNRETVAGGRLELDVRRAAGLLPGADSLNLAVFGVHDGLGGASTDELAGPGSARLAGAEMQLRQGGLAAVAEVLHSEHADSTSLAGQARVEVALPGERGRLEGGWLRVGDGFASSLNPRLRSGLEEWTAAAEVRPLSGTLFRARHERQRFRNFDVQRSTTTATAEQALGGAWRMGAEGGLRSDRVADGESESLLGRLGIEAGSTGEAWVEAQRSLSQVGDGAPRAELIGLGAAYRVLPFARLEATHRWIRPAPDSAVATVSGVTVRTDLPLGGRAWSGVERVAAERQSHAAVLGWDQRLSLEGGWQFHTFLERRFGVDRIPVADPERALPFAQSEPDRWTAAWGVEYLPLDGPRFGARHEVRGGATAGWRVDVTADAPLSRAFVFLTRHDWWKDSRVGLPGGETRRDRSLFGVALRPAGHGTLNALGKVEYRHALNPLGSAVLAGSAEEWRLIGATDAIWAPHPRWIFAGRYALRRTSAEDADGNPGARSTAHYVGGRLEHAFPKAIGLRLDGRLLSEQVTQSVRWSVAPSLAIPLTQGLEVEGGYRFGALQDPDFAAYGRNGFFALLSLRFTEGTMRDAAAYWRERLAAEP